MSFKMKGSPAKMGTIQGTSSHASALKALESSPAKHTGTDPNTGKAVTHPGPDGHTGHRMRIKKLKKKKLPAKGNPNWTDKATELDKKIKALKSEGKTVENSRKMRKLQNKMNKELKDDTRHRKNIFTGGKYKKDVSRNIIGVKKDKSKRDTSTINPWD